MEAAWVSCRSRFLQFVRFRVGVADGRRSGRVVGVTRSGPGQAARVGGWAGRKRRVNRGVRDAAEGEPGGVGGELPGGGVGELPVGQVGERLLDDRVFSELDDSPVASRIGRLAGGRLAGDADSWDAEVDRASAGALVDLA